MTQQRHAKGLFDYGAILWRRRVLFLPIFMLLTLVSATVVLLLPATFLSQSTILIEDDLIPKELVRTSVGQYGDKRIQIITKRVMTRSNLISIAEQHGLYPEAWADGSFAHIVKLMRQNIEIRMVSADVVNPLTGRSGEVSIAFVVSFKHESPQTAQQITKQLVSLFLEENRRKRTELVEETSAVLGQEAARYRKIIADLELQLGEFKLSHADALPGMVDTHLRALERLERQLADNDRDLRSLRERKLTLESELAQVSRNAIVYASDGSPVQHAANRLKTLRAELVTKAAVYAHNHPDLVKLRREISALQAEVSGGDDTTEIEAKLSTLRTELAQNRQRYSEIHPTVRKLERQIAGLENDLAMAQLSAGPALSSQPDNPAYIEIHSRLRGTEIEIPHYLESRSAIQARIEDYQDKIARAPAVERELNTLTRDYDNALNRYRELTSRQWDAELASTLERDNEDEHLILIEPALLPEKPIKPNRPVLMLLGLLLSFGTAVGATGLREYLDDSVRTSQDLTTLLNHQPLGVIPFIEERDSGHARRPALVVGAAALAALILVGWWFAHWTKETGPVVPGLGISSLQSKAVSHASARSDEQASLAPLPTTERKAGL
jgi:uncharacterized protein involved in exopolysaccharide biosynthesis